MEFHDDAAQIAGLPELHLTHEKANRLVRRLEPVAQGLGAEQIEVPFWWRVAILAITALMIYAPMLIALRMKFLAPPTPESLPEPPARGPQVELFDFGATPSAEAPAPNPGPVAGPDPGLPPQDVPGIGRVVGNMIIPEQ